LQQTAGKQVVRRALDDGPLRTPRDAPDCPGYENNAEVRKSYTEAGHLSIDVRTFPLGSDNLVVADYGVDWGSPKDSTRTDPILQANLSTFEGDASRRWTIVGFSDCVGNERDTYLRWRRAKKIHNLLTPAARARASVEVAPLGEFVQPNDTVEHRAMNRGVVIKRSKTTVPTPEAPPDHVCGPDATKWFLDQVDAGRKDGDVLRVKSNLDIAKSILAGLNLSADLIAIGMVAERVKEAQQAAGSPAFKGKAQEQLLNAALSGGMAVKQAEDAVKHMDTLQLIQLRRAADLLKGAALTWKALVATGARYDFKNSASTLQNPRSDNCPKSCNSTVTLAGMCLLKDVPGNLFFAHIGRFVGWQELTLQLGSQWAQLLASKDWDPPEDTALIALGFNLPEPLTEQGLRDALAGGAKDFSRQCSLCREPLRADIV
jgi:hypothetical protein